MDHKNNSVDIMTGLLRATTAWSTPKAIRNDGYDRIIIIKIHLATNLTHNGDYLYGLYYLECYFCKRFFTPIEFDMELHIYQLHRKELFTTLPVRRKGSTFDGRLEFVLAVMRKKAKSD